MLPSCGTVTGFPGLQRGNIAGKPQAAASPAGKGLVKGVAPVQVGESSSTSFERSAAHTA
jgi:hypothetical protein